MVVLLLGVVTDYCVFQLSGMRARLRAGEPERRAAVRATTQVLPIIVTAGLLVARRAAHAPPREHRLRAGARPVDGGRGR